MLRDSWNETILSGMRLALLLTLATSMVACRQTTEPPGQIALSLQANTADVARAHTETVTVNATGNNLFGVVIDSGVTTSEQ